MRFSVELSVEENGFVQTNKGYLRDAKVELQDILKWTKTQLIVIADSVLTEEQAKGFDTNPIVLVDGKKGKRISDVNPLGSIEFVSRKNIEGILALAYTSLHELSKVKSGRYKDSHYVFLNGTQVATDLSSMGAWLRSNPSIKENDVVRIVNIQPYARKLELMGITAGRSLRNKKERTFKRKGQTRTVVVNKPNGAYQLALRRVQSKYKNNVNASFRFLPGSSLGISGSFKNGKDAKSVGRPYLYPTLFFKISQDGIF